MVHPAKILSRLRTGANLTQRKLASDLGVSQALICAYEKATVPGGRTPPLHVALRLLDSLNASSDIQLKYFRGLSRISGDYAAVAGAIRALKPVDDVAELAAWRQAAMHQEGNAERQRVLAVSAA